MKMKSQATIVGLFITFILVLIYFGIRPALITTINNANLTAGSAESTIAGLYDFFFLASILISFLYYVIPQRVQSI